MAAGSILALVGLTRSVTHSPSTGAELGGNTLRFQGDTATRVRPWPLPFLLPVELLLLSQDVSLQLGYPDGANSMAGVQLGFYKTADFSLS